MALRKILVIDDERAQAEALKETFYEIIPGADVSSAWTKDDILEKIENSFYNLAVLDIRMDELPFDGIRLSKMIIEVNPFTKILFVSKFASEYMEDLNQLFSNGKILGFSEKKDYEKWKPELQNITLKYFEELESEPKQVNNVLLQLYADARNEPVTYKKGVMFENFVTLLFRSIGFYEVMKRVKDKTLNEVDLVVRNDIEDPFLAKFGKYFLIECKNKPEYKINKNDFILFSTKVSHTDGLSELGFLFTSSSITRNTYLEAIRESKETKKIIFVDNRLINQLLAFPDLKDGLKKLIDNQVKDN
jgi:CheY-like chemotaxis protein